MEAFLFPVVGYVSPQAKGALVMSKTLDNLKRDLESAVANLAAANLEVEHIRLAISAIEDSPEPRRSTRTGAKIRKRGAVSRVVLDCIREGVGQVRLIKQTLDDRGHKLTSGSISNAIARLQERELIRHDHSIKKWVIRDLSGSPKAEGPEDFSPGLLHSNGATDWHSGSA